MATQSPQMTEPPPFSWDQVIIPFTFLHLSRIEQLELLPGYACYRLTGSYPEDRERRPQDPLTAWVTVAHLGLIEKGEPLPELDPELDREQRLDEASKLLTADELVIVETIAVPKRYRDLSALQLEAMVRTAPDYIDRMWAACWLTLVGWTESTESTFRDSSEMPANTCGELEETVIDAYAVSIGVTSRDDVQGWRKVDDNPEVLLASRRLHICETHYSLNGPPSYELMKTTVPVGPEWEQVIRIVPRSAN
jgi:hypothetical protein